MREKYDTLSRYRLGLRCTCPKGERSDWCDVHGDSRWNNLDVTRLVVPVEREPVRWAEPESSLLGSLIIVGVAAAITAALLGVW